MDFPPRNEPIRGEGIGDAIETEPSSAPGGMRGAPQTRPATVSPDDETVRERNLRIIQQNQAAEQARDRQEAAQAAEEQQADRQRAAEAARAGVERATAIEQAAEQQAERAAREEIVRDTAPREPQGDRSTTTRQVQPAGSPAVRGQ
jgi:hypothetical protein